MNRTLIAGLIALICSSCAVSDRNQSTQSMKTITEPAHSWVQVWGDEFDQGVVDSNKWELALDCTDHGNNEAQCYTPREENIYAGSDGILHIVAREEAFSGPARSSGHAQYDADDTSVTKSYTSARLRTKNRFDFKYGRVEVRARLTGGQGMWPAIWMLPTDWVYGGWPSSGELDIMEAVSLDTEGAVNQVHGSMNYGMKWPQWSAIGKNYVSGKSYTREFHTFMIEWEADEIRWFIDGVHYQTQTSAGWYNYIWGNQQSGFGVANPRAPYDQDFHLLLNLAVGGNWPGQPDKNWRGEREFLVDYVRVYQCGSGIADGTGCASAAEAPIDTSIEPTPDGGAPRVNRFPLFEHSAATLVLKSGDISTGNTLAIESSAQTSGDVVIDTTDVGGAHGKVLDINFIGPGRVSLSSAEPSDAAGIESSFSLSGGTAWSNHGTLEFDLFVQGIDSDTQLLAGLGNAYPDQGLYAIEIPAIGEWIHVAIRVSDLLANPREGGKGIDLDNIAKLMVIDSTGSSSARIRVDNIFLSCAVNGYSKKWQWDTACSIEPVRSIE